MTNNRSVPATSGATGNLTEAAADNAVTDATHQGRDDYFMDIDRMVNEGLGGGNVTINNGLIEETTTDTMRHPESVQE
ncbi:hypothetical protein [Paenibacillus rigui]|uniref:DUF4025 domain-containing protein n=1 Tax=Paenibacillus rigui TaxID=554312 RepID=A0A229UM67_9BACL|nr:hypothetical protein [Paenibacillus rigui]OXM84462.1 hypothetical protein CF651_20530 [Paenibacillus rigui]